MKIVLLERIRRQKRQVLLRMGLGLLCLLLAGVPWLPSLRTLKPKATGVSGQALCLGAWRGLADGFQVNAEGPRIRVSHALTRDPKLMLSQASLGIALCHAQYRVKAFCMGQSCARPGLQLLLAPRIGSPND